MTWNENVSSKFILQWKLLKENYMLSFLFDFLWKAQMSTVHWFRSSLGVRQGLWQGLVCAYCSYWGKFLPGIRRNNHFINYSQRVKEKIWVHRISIIPPFLLSSIILFLLEFFLGAQTRSFRGWAEEGKTEEEGREGWGVHRQTIPHKCLWYSGLQRGMERGLTLKLNIVTSQMLPRTSLSDSQTAL